MQEPSVRTSRLAISGGIAAALIVGGVGFLLGRSTVAIPPPAASATPPPAAPVEPAAEKPDVLNRGDIIAAARRAADALTSGAAVPPALADLPGRRFTFALPFGCAGPAGPDSSAPLRWSYDDANQALRVHVALIVWDPEEWGVKAANALIFPRGFWVTRPWSSGETCPAATSEATAIATQPVTLPGQTLALVNFGAGATGHEAGYEAVVRIPRDKLMVKQGLRIRISGRVDHIPDDGPVRCVQPAGIEQQPVCAVAAIFDEMVLDNPATGETIATWAIGKAEGGPPAE